MKKRAIPGKLEVKQRKRLEQQTIADFAAYSLRKAWMFSAWHKSVFGFDGTSERCTRRMWRVRSVVSLVVLSCMTFACDANRNPSTPAIEFTKVPLASEGGPDRTAKIEGRVVGAHPGQRIVLFARSGAWWVQPFIDQPFTLIQPDSRWRTTTHFGTQYAALLVDANYQPPASTNFLPSVGQGVVAVTVVKGRPVFWQTPWFLLVAMLASAAIVAGYSRYRLRRLANEEARFREALETIPAMTFTTSSDGSNTFVNKRWTEYAGLSVEETSGAGWQRAIHPEDIARHSEKWRTSVASGQLFEDEARFRRAADGEYRWFLVRGVPFRDRNGNIVKWYGTLTDIEDRKRAEEALQLTSHDLQEGKAKLEEAQRIAHVGYWQWDLVTNRVNWSDETYRIYGLRPQERPIEIAGIREMIHLEDREFVFRAAEEAVRGGEAPELEHRIVRPGGEVRFVHSQGHLMRDASGRICQMFGTVQDITERKRVEEEGERLRQLEADLAHFNRVNMLGELAASLAHEIKQPIAAAITSANACLRWLEHDPPDLERARAAVRRVDRDGNRAADVINRLRSFYRKGTPQRELVDVAEIVGEIIVLLRNEASRHSVSIQSEIGADIPKIFADGVQLQQVFMNLMLNGIEAMEGSGGELAITARLQDSDLLFSVSDNGVGLPAENLDQIFSAFFTTKSQGSGMGLAISRSIVESHGGRLWAAVNNGRGATFHFTLPIEMRESPATA